MRSCPFCSAEAQPPSSRYLRLAIFRRVWEGLQWLFPTALLVMTPKCPMCLAAYIMLLTGVGVSMSVARCVWILTPLICVLWLVFLGRKFLGGKFLRRFRHRLAGGSES